MNRFDFIADKIQQYDDAQLRQEELDKERYEQLVKDAEELASDVKETFDLILQVKAACDRGIINRTINLSDMSTDHLVISPYGMSYRYYRWTVILSKDGLTLNYSDTPISKAVELAKKVLAEYPRVKAEILRQFDEITGFTEEDPVHSYEIPLTLQATICVDAKDYQEALHIASDTVSTLNLNDMDLELGEK